MTAPVDKFMPLGNAAQHLTAAGFAARVAPGGRVGQDLAERAFFGLGQGGGVPMNVPDHIDRALARLSHTLDHLEAAVGRRAEGDAARANLEDELAVMQDDRARLAVELDGALARAAGLAAANGEVAARLERMSAAVEAMLGALAPGAEPFEPV